MALFSFAATVLAASAIGAFVFGASYERGLLRVEAEGREQLRFITNALEKDLARYKLLAKSLSQTGVVRRRAFTTSDDAFDEAALLFDRMSAISGAESINYVAKEAMRGGPDARAASEATFGILGAAFDPADGGVFVIAAPVTGGGSVAGAVVVRLSADQLEWSWRALPETIFFTGPDGSIRLSSLPQLRLERLDPETYPSPLTADESRALWSLADLKWGATGSEKSVALAIAQPTPSVGMTGHALIDVAPARRAAWLAAIAAAALVAVIGLVAMIALQRRAAIAHRLAMEARAKTELEIMVADRTVELTAEIAERREAEKRLRETQEELVQAGKLSALGKMAAGIAHEINQPLAAIRTFADNAAAFLDRGREEKTRENLTEIAALTDRAARIIRNLRAFARNEAVEARAVDVADVIDDALAILSPRIRETGAEILWARPKTTALAMAGGVRMQQVVVNLVTNALDAQPVAPKVEVSVETSDAHLRLCVRDHGPGLSESERGRVFDPFFTTKSDGGGEGLGLGLSITYGIVKGFGGRVMAANHRDGGAVFTVELPRADDLLAAS